MATTQFRYDRPNVTEAHFFMVDALLRHMPPDDLKAEYDASVDVLRLSRGDRVEAEGDGLPNGVELDYSLEDGAPCGVTVLGYKRNGWGESTGNLAEIAADHLGVRPAALVQIVKRAVR